MGIEIPMTGNAGSAEHRQARRYRFRGDATARPLESGIALPGRVLDLSALGCLLMVPNLSEFAVGTLVDVSVNSSSIAFRALGSVRHCNPNHWRIGISFVNLSRRGEADLLELIAELDAAEQLGRPCVHEITVIRHNPPALEPGEILKE
jgi:hypothetical protein